MQAVKSRAVPDNYAYTPTQDGAGIAALTPIVGSGNGAVVVAFGHRIAPVADVDRPVDGSVAESADAADTAYLNAHDLRSILATMDFIAEHRAAKIDVLHALVEAEFSVPSLGRIPQNQFHQVMEFLIDLRVDSVRSRR